MPHIPFHPAPGFGDLSPGWFVVPQNPMRSDGTALVPSVQATAPGRVVRVPSLNDLVQASFVVPQNPLVPHLSGLRGLGCGCSQLGCDGGRDFYALNGIADDLSSSFDGVKDWLQSPSPVAASVPNWMLYGGAAVAAYFAFSSGSNAPRGRRRAS